VQNTYIWYRNNVPIVALDMPFDTNPQYTAVVKDYSGFGNDGTTYNSWSKDTLKLWPSWGTGIVGGAYNFNENQFIKIPGNASLGDGTWTEITLECWIKPKDLSKQSTIIARKTYEGTIGSYMMGFQDSASNKLFWGVTTGGTYKVLNDSTTLNPNTWYHIVCTYKSGSGLKIYINGALSASMSLSGVIDVGIVNEDLYIGGSRSAGSANRYLNASLDEVRIYRRALSDQQILQRYSETKNGSSNSSTIVSAETSNLDVWSCKVTPNDSYQDGATKVSNTLTVIDSGVGAPHADIYIEHTWVGDLVVTIGVGKIDNPLWSNVVWNRKGGSQKNLTLTIDLTGKEQYLAPSSSAPFDHLWFVNVYDAATGDQGRVVWFNITYQETTYVSTDVPKGVFDYQTTSVYNPNAPSYPFASVYIEHTYIGDLNVTIGVGPTATPSWSKVVWNRQGGGTDNLNLTIDLSAAVNYLPPSGTNQWFLRVYDGGTGDQGRIIWFNITYQGQTYLSSDVPVNIADFKTSYAFIPSGPAPPSPPSANVVIQHSYVGDLNVTIGVGSRSSPSWSQVIWNRAGGRGTGSLNLTVDLSAAVAYLPPSADSTWFLRVYDGAAGDTGTITSFTITYQNQTFVSQDVPVSISDFQTSYANIPPAPSAPVAHVYIQHMWIGDLIVDIGVGNTTSPQWSNRIWNGTGSQGSGYLDLTIDLTDAAAYLPPSSSNTWFLKVYDRYAKDTGTIVEFTIKYMGTTYVSTDVPVPILDKQTSYAYISG
jgi:subtilisin-like proprotein convertase family protein